MKSYTDIPQSERLVKILPLESADMYYREWKRMTKHIRIAHVGSAGENDLPCWSLAALLNVLPKIYYPVKDHKTDLILGKPKDKWCLLYWDTIGMQHGEETLGDNPVDACYEMIIRFKERNLI